MIYNIMRLVNGAATLVAAIQPEGKQAVKAMGQNVVDMQFKSPVYIDFKPGDYFTLDNDTYKLNTVTAPVEKKGERSYDYTIQFEHAYYDCAKVMLLGLNQANQLLEPNFSIMGTAATIIDLIVQSMNRNYSGWSFGQVDNTDYKLYTFSGQNCLQVLNQLASEIGTEFWIFGKTIHLTKIEQSSGLILGQGMDNGLMNIRRLNKTNTNIVTRLYVRGSSENLPVGYRNFAGNLLLPGGATYIEDPAKVALYGLIEASQTFDIKPEREGTITAVVAGEGNWKYFTDSSMDFDINDVKLSDAVKIAFNTGQLAGYSFTLANYNNATKTFTINKNDEEKSFDIPSNLLRPAVGDKYVILNIQMPAPIVTAAENKLGAVALDAYKQISEPKFLLSYSALCDRHYIKNNNVQVVLGNTAIIRDTDMGLDVEVRIASYVRDLQDRNLYDEVEWSDTIGINEIVRQAAQQQKTLRLIESSGILDADQLRKSIFLNRLGELNGYLMLGGNKVKAGFADYAQDAAHASVADYSLDSDKWDGRQFADYLNQPVRINDDVRFKSLSSPSFVSGFTGSGFQVDENGNATVDNLTVRKQMNVYELTVNKINATNGALAVTDTIKLLGVTADGGAHYSGFIDTANGSVLVPFAVNDLIRCQVWNGNAIKYYFARVNYINPQASAFSFTIIDGAGIPAAGDVLARFGSTSNVNRQGLIYITASDSNAPYMDVLDGVTSANLTGKTKVRLGKLNGIVDADFGALQGYGLYGENVYLKNGKYKGEIIVTGGNAQTIAGSQALANAAQNNAVDVIIGNGKVRTPLLDSDDVRAVTAKIGYLNGLEFNFTQGTVDRLKARVINAQEIVVNGGGATVNQAQNFATQAGNNAVVVANNLVNSLQIGGVNLINESIPKDILNSSQVENYIYYIIENNSLEPNTTYTLSWEYLTSGNFMASEAFILPNLGDVLYKGGLAATNNVWIKEKFTFKTSNNYSGASEGYIRFDHNGSTDGNNCQLAIRFPKLEKGSYATSFSLSASDINSNATKLANTAQTNAISSASMLSGAAQVAAQNYATTQSAYEREIAKSYADGKISSEEIARINQAAANLAEAKADSQSKFLNAVVNANSYTDSKTIAAISTAQSYADSVSSNKASAAQTAAVVAASANAQSYANQAQSNAVAASQSLVNSLSIGGVNLLNNTVQKEVFNPTQSEVYIYYELPNQITPNTIYTISWEYLTSGNFITSEAFFLPNIGGMSYVDGLTATNNVWVRKFFTFTTGNNYSGTTGGVIRFDHNGSTDGNNCLLTVRNVKLEKGNKPTDYSPSIADTNALIVNAQNAANNANSAYTNLTSRLKNMSEIELDGLEGITTTNKNGITTIALSAAYVKANMINAQYINTLDFVAKNISTATSGKRVQITQADNNIRMYDGNNNILMELDDDSAIERIRLIPAEPGVPSHFEVTYGAGLRIGNVGSRHASLSRNGLFTTDQSGNKQHVIGLNDLGNAAKVELDGDDGFIIKNLKDYFGNTGKSNVRLVAIYVQDYQGNSIPVIGFEPA